MNEIAGSITFKWMLDIHFSDVKFHSVKNNTPDGNTNVYFYGRTNLASSKEFIDYVSMSVGGEVVSVDISISSEDTLNLYTEDPMDGEYMLTSLEGISETFVSALDKFEWSSPSIVAIREAGKSTLFWNKIIKIDIVY